MTLASAGSSSTSPGTLMAAGASGAPGTADVSTRAKCRQPRRSRTSWHGSALPPLPGPRALGRPSVPVPLARASLPPLRRVYPGKAPGPLILSSCHDDVTFSVKPPDALHLPRGSAFSPQAPPPPPQPETPGSRGEPEGAGRFPSACLSASAGLGPCPSCWGQRPLRRCWGVWTPRPGCCLDLVLWAVADFSRQQ